MTPALHAAAIEFEWLEAGSPGLFPEGALTALLMSLLPFAVEDSERAWWVAVPRGTKALSAHGEHFGFELRWLSGAAADVDILLAALHALPKAPRLDAALTFRDNVRLSGCRCLASGKTISRAIETQALDLAAFDAPPSTGILRWQWLSPARLLKSPADRPDGGEARFCRRERDVVADLLWERVLSTLSLLKLLDQPPPAPAWRIAAQEQFWLPLRYRGSGGREKPLGGLLGEVLLVLEEPLNPATARALALAGWLGIGQRRGFGLGRFAVIEATLGVSEPSRSAFSELSDPARWRDAHAHVSRDSELQSDHQPLTDDLNARISAFQAEDWRASALYPLELPKADGSARQLQVPPFWERVAQRVVLDTLVPAFSPFESDCSFGFRRGRSREQARDALLAHARDGRRHVLESDIDDFFPSVDPWRIAVRLRALFGDDPLITRILAWISAPLRLVDGSLQERPRGLPQGSPLSPWLANLLLSDFDHDFASARLALVRFADDFVVACATAADAKRALKLAQESLAVRGLALKLRKTALTSFDQGFDFLGFRFVGELAIAAKERMPIPPLADFQPVPAAQIHADRAFAALEPPRTIRPLGNAQPTAPTVSEVVSAAPDPLAAPATATLGTWLVLSGAPVQLRRTDNQWQVTEPSGQTHTLPGETLAAIIAIGPQRVSSGAITYALDVGTPVHFVSSTGRYRGALWPHGQGPDAALWRAQSECFADPVVQLLIARQLVHARVAWQRQLLNELRLSPPYDPLRNTLEQIDSCTSTERLRGLEGSAARLYFQCLARALDPSWGFAGRARRPPPDPFNALLSLGFSVLHGIANTWIHAIGLCPTGGVYHQSHGRHATLASDLIEPLRHRVERHAFLCLHERQFAASDFSPRPSGGSALDAPKRRRFISQLLDQFARPEADSSRPRTVDEACRATLWSLIAQIRGSGTLEIYRPR